MMKSEFENLAGRAVTNEQYRAIETLYMSSNLEKAEFVKSIRTMLKSIPQPERKKDIKRMVVGWRFYMCKDPIDACKFLVIRGMRQMSVIELELDEKEVEESHDHSETFFKCKAYIKHGDIVLSGDERIFDYDFE